MQSTQNSEPLYPGGRSIAVNETGDLALVGGSDGVVGVYSVSQGQVVQTLKCGGGSVTDAVWCGNKPVVALSTGAVKVFNNGAEVASFDRHAGAVSAVALHPCGDILASVGVDKSYVLYDLQSLQTITQVSTDSGMSNRSKDEKQSLTLPRTHHCGIPPRRSPFCSRQQQGNDQAFRCQDFGKCGQLRLDLWTITSSDSILLRERHMACVGSTRTDQCQCLGLAQDGRDQDDRPGHSRDWSQLGLHWTVPRSMRTRFCGSRALLEELKELVRAGQKGAECSRREMGTQGTEHSCIGDRWQRERLVLVKNGRRGRCLYVLKAGIQTRKKWYKTKNGLVMNRR
jgi:WD40 repeat protein